MFADVGRQFAAVQAERDALRHKPFPEAYDHVAAEEERQEAVAALATERAAREKAEALVQQHIDGHPSALFAAARERARRSEQTLCDIAIALGSAPGLRDEMVERVTSLLADLARLRAIETAARDVAAEPGLLADARPTAGPALDALRAALAKQLG